MRTMILAIALALAPIAASAQEMTEDQVKQLALEAILENPDIIREAILLLEQQQQAAQAAAQSDLLQQQRALLESDPNAPFTGPATADAVVVEFFDYNCPYCKRAAEQVKTLLSQDDNVKIVYREWPILGEGSVFAARAALAARAQGKYEAMHWALMEMRGRAEEASVLAAARNAGLDIDQLRADMNSPEVTAHIETTQALAQGLGFTGTPAFVIGNALVPGAVPIEDLEGYIATARAAQQ